MPCQDELQVRPEVHSASVVFSKRITVTLKNISNREVILKRGTPLTHIFPVALVPQLTASTDKEPSATLTLTSFDFGKSPMPEDA